MRPYSEKGSARFSSKKITLLLYMDRITVTYTLKMLPCPHGEGASIGEPLSSQYKSDMGKTQL